MIIPSHFPSEPGTLWGFFHAINQLPRPSKEEDKFREFIVNEALSRGPKTFVDEGGSVIVYVPTSPGMENHETVIIQNHMDMVTDATPDRQINFSTDPIITLREGEWIKADRTTLGTDNGIGRAAALTLMIDKTVIHSPLDLLFTIDEVTRLKGAWGVDGR
jgi:dipeptidase D